jgi:hypothetical protein
MPCSLAQLRRHLPQIQQTDGKKESKETYRADKINVKRPNATIPLALPHATERSDTLRLKDHANASHNKTPSLAQIDPVGGLGRLITS